MRLDKIWIVTNPTPKSEIADILFSATMAELELQFRGGLGAKDIVAVFTDECSARALADCLMSEATRPPVCTYDAETERYSRCDGHHRCECPVASVDSQPGERHSSSESHAVLIAEITRLRTENQVLRGVLKKAMHVIGEVAT